MSLTVTGVVRLDLRGLDGHQLDRKVQQAADSPPGAAVVFHVERGQLAPYSGAPYLREYGQHLGLITVDCDDPTTVGQWVRALRGKEDGV